MHAPITETADPSSEKQAEEEDSMEGSHTVSVHQQQQQPLHSSSHYALGTQLGIFSAQYACTDNCNIAVGCAQYHYSKQGEQAVF